MAEDMIPRIETDILNGTYTKVFVNSQSIDLLTGSFNIGQTLVNFNKVMSQWVLTFLDENAVTQTLCTITNAYGLFTNMDLYFFSSGSINAFTYLLFTSNNSYLFDYKNNLLGVIPNSGYITSWTLEPDENLATYFTTREADRRHGYVCTLLLNQVLVDVRLVSLTNTVNSIVPSTMNKGRVTLVNGTAVVLNTSANLNNYILLTSQQDSGTPGFLRITSIVAGVSFTITSGSFLDNSTVAWLMV